MINRYRSIFAPLSRATDVLLLLVRVAIGILFIDHGLQKYTAQGGLAAFQGFLKSLGNVPAPEVTSRVVPLIEIAGGTLLILGLLTRVLAAVLAVEMVITGFLVKLHDLHAPIVSQTMAGVELDAVYLLVLLTLLVVGAGRLSADVLIGLEGSARTSVRRPAMQYSAS